MPSLHRFVLGLSLLGVSFPALTATADGWLQYRGPAGDGRIAASPGLRPLAGKMSTRWVAPTPLGFSSFAIGDGKAFTLIARDDSTGARREHLIALDADTGSELWAVPLGASEYGHDGGNSGAPGNRGGDGPRATPSTDGRNVFVYDSHMKLTCFRAGDGRQVWQNDILADFDGRTIKWLNATSPLMDGDSIYIAGGGQGQSFLAFDKNSGRLLWKSGDEYMTHATPHLTTIGQRRQVIYFMQSGLVSVDAGSGEEIWRTDFPFSVSTAASPVSQGDHVYCSAGYGVGAGLFRIDGGSTAREVWFKPNELMNHWSTPVVHDGHLFGLFEFKKYGRAPLQCVDLKTGEIKWSQRGFGPGNCILVGDRLAVLSDSGSLVIVEATPQEYREIGRSQVIEGKCWSTPAYSQGRIYIRSTKEAACIEFAG